MMTGDIASGLAAAFFIGIAIAYGKYLNKLELVLYLLTAAFLISSRVFMRINLTVCYVLLGLTVISLICLFILIYKKRTKD